MKNGRYREETINSWWDIKEKDGPQLVRLEEWAERNSICLPWTPMARSRRRKVLAGIIS